jgi:hypothetical protein
MAGRFPSKVGFFGNIGLEQPDPSLQEVSNQLWVVASFNMILWSFVLNTKTGFLFVLVDILFADWLLTARSLDKECANTN